MQSVRSLVPRKIFINITRPVSLDEFLYYLFLFLFLFFSFTLFHSFRESFLWEIKSKLIRGLKIRWFRIRNKKESYNDSRGFSIYFSGEERRGRNWRESACAFSPVVTCKGGRKRVCSHVKLKVPLPLFERGRQQKEMLQLPRYREYRITSSPRHSSSKKKKKKKK